jgi:antitoxin MazE
MSGNVATTHLVRIGNSRGVRIPKIWIEQLDWHDEVEMSVQAHRLVIRAARHPRQDWDEKFRAMHERSDDRSVEDLPHLPASAWDQQEWDW